MESMQNYVTSTRFPSYSGHPGSVSLKLSTRYDPAPCSFFYSTGFVSLKLNFNSVSHILGLRPGMSLPAQLDLKIGPSSMTASFSRNNTKLVRLPPI